MTGHTKDSQRIRTEDMDIATVSPGYKIYIPRPVREALGIRPGEQVQVACDGDQIRVVPLREHEAAASTR